MFSTLRIWKWTAMVDNDYNAGLFRNLLKNWPWRKPWRTLESWKYSYKWNGGKEFLKERLEKLSSTAHFWLFTKYSKDFRKQCRITYLESALWSAQSLARYYGELAEQAEYKTMVTSDCPDCRKPRRFEIGLECYCHLLDETLCDTCTFTQRCVACGYKKERGT